MNDLEEFETIKDREDSKRKLLFKQMNKSMDFKDPDIFKPKKGEDYYPLSPHLLLEVECRCDAIDDFYFDIGGVYRTKEEATEDFEKRKLQTLWKRLSIYYGENENPWDGNHNHYNIFYNYVLKLFEIKIYKSVRGEGIYFPTEKSIKEAMHIIGEDKVKKYILGVEDPTENTILVTEEE